MIDATSYLRENTNESANLMPLDGGSNMPELEVGDQTHEEKKAGTETTARTDDSHQDVDQSSTGSYPTKAPLVIEPVANYNFFISRRQPH